MSQVFVVHCGDCSHEWDACTTPLSVEAFARAAKRPCPSCGSRRVFCGPVPRPTADGDAVGWLSHGDTGISSLTIWAVMMRETKRPYCVPNTPQDPADFGRCYRLLRVMPSWRPRLPEVARRFPAWQPFVAAWDELTALYEAEVPTGRCPRLYERMAELQGERP